MYLYYFRIIITQTLDKPCIKFTNIRCKYREISKYRPLWVTDILSAIQRVQSVENLLLISAGLSLFLRALYLELSIRRFFIE